MADQIHGSSAGHGHDHGLARARGRALWGSLGANSVLLVVQVTGALVFGSLALLADSVHQLSDVVSLVVALVAFRLAARPGTERFTYGLRRAEVMGALVNAVLLIAAAGWITVEAVDRLGTDYEIDGVGVVVLAVVGLVVNTGSAVWIARVSEANLNLRGAMVHLAADAAGSAAVLVSGVAVLLWDATWTDPVLSLAIAVMVAWQGGRILLRTTHIFLEGTPSGVDLERLEATLEAEDAVRGIHHLHVWSLDSETVALTAHVLIDEADLHEAQNLATRLETALEEEGVEHTTLALECHDCRDTT